MTRVGIATLLMLFAVAGGAVASELDLLDFTTEEDFVFRTPAVQTSETVDEAGHTYDGPSPFAGRMAYGTGDREITRHVNLAMAQGDATESGPNPSSGVGIADKKNPGRAILLSALIPGAGQLYAQKPFWAAGFFIVEAAMIGGAVSYAIQGADKEDEYESFARTHWDEELYRDFEYWLATSNPNLPQDERFGGDQTSWNQLPWGEKLTFLPNNFTHELPEQETQQYFEMIGKYLSQFGVGWPSDLIDPNNPDYQSFLNQLSRWDQDSDDFEGWPSNQAATYIDMRDQSNQLLNMSANFTMVLMVNHVASALHAGFAVRSHNRKIAEAQMGMDTHYRNGEYVPMAKLNITW
ncbi:hypothetical protein GF324_00490 [bacterium]|nr:hypothetical protein [bacterium]